jgi:hypothetical protein
MGLMKGGGAVLYAVLYAVYAVYVVYVVYVVHVVYTALCSAYSSSVGQQSKDSNGHSKETHPTRTHVTHHHMLQSLISFAVPP